MIECHTTPKPPAAWGFLRAPLCHCEGASRPRNPFLSVGAGVPDGPFVGADDPVRPPRPQARNPRCIPLEGFAVLNDTPVACQTREPTDPQGDLSP